MEADFGDHDVERKVSIPVDLEGQVAGVDGQIQLFDLIVVQFFVVRILDTIDGTYESFLWKRVQTRWL